MNLTVHTNPNIIHPTLVPSKHNDYIQLTVKCPNCGQRHNHGPGEGWRVSDCFNRKTGRKMASVSYCLEIDWTIPAHKKLKERYDKLIRERG